jgi:hypothetical protein
VTGRASAWYGDAPRARRHYVRVAASGVGAIVGEPAAVPTGRRDSGELARRWGVAFMLPAALLLAIGLLLGC